jgi:hypothetical protein
MTGLVGWDWAGRMGSGYHLGSGLIGIRDGRRGVFISCLGNRRSVPTLSRAAHGGSWGGFGATGPQGKQTTCLARWLGQASLAQMGTEVLEKGGMEADALGQEGYQLVHARFILSVSGSISPSLLCHPSIHQHWPAMSWQAGRIPTCHTRRAE